MKKIIFGLVAAVAIIGSPTVSLAEVCFTSGIRPAEHSSILNDNLMLGEFNPDYVIQAAPTCESIDNVSDSLQASALVLGLGGIVAACTVAGVTATLFFELAATGLLALDLVVNNIPCEEPKVEEKIQNQIREAVCFELNLNDIDCDLHPNDIQGVRQPKTHSEPRQGSA